MATKKYPIGTLIRYMGYCTKCKGKVGKIVEIHDNYCYIVLPQSTCSTFTSTGKAMCSWDDLELLVKKNEQLEFAFMNDG